eukprot:UN00191
MALCAVYYNEFVDIDMFSETSLITISGLLCFLVPYILLIMVSSTKPRLTKQSRLCNWNNNPQINADQDFKKIEKRFAKHYN